MKRDRVKEIRVLSNAVWKDSRILTDARLAMLELLSEIVIMMTERDRIFSIAFEEGEFTIRKLERIRKILEMGGNCDE